MAKKVVSADEVSKARHFERILRSAPDDAPPSAKLLEAAIFVKRRAARMGEDLDSIMTQMPTLADALSAVGETPLATAALSGNHRARCAMLAVHFAALATEPEASADDEDYSRAVWDMFLVRRLGDAETPRERRQRFMRALDRYAGARERGQVELLQSFERPRDLAALAKQLDALADAWTEKKSGRRKDGAPGKYKQLSALFAETDMAAVDTRWEKEAAEINLPSASARPR